MIFFFQAGWLKLGAVKECLEFTWLIRAEICTQAGWAQEHPSALLGLMYKASSADQVFWNPRLPAWLVQVLLPLCLCSWRATLHHAVLHSVVNRVYSLFRASFGLGHLQTSVIPAHNAVSARPTSPFHKGALSDRKAGEVLACRLKYSPRHPNAFILL